MSSPSATKVYWDACVFLSLIEGTPDRLPHIESVLDEVTKGQIAIYTSVFSIAEVSFAKSEKDGRVLVPAIEKKINGLWSSDSPFELVEVYRTLTLGAQKLVRAAMAKGIRLTPPDAIHLATAKRIGAKEFQTYDFFKGKAKDIESLVGIKIVEPGVNGKFVWTATGDSPNERTRKKPVAKAKQKSKKKKVGKQKHKRKTKKKQ